MTKQDFFLLIEKHLNGLTTDIEKQQLLNFTSFFQNSEWNEEMLGDPSILKNELYERVKNSLDLASYSPTVNLQSTVSSPVRRVHFLKTAWFRYAAAILILIIGSVAYLWNNSQRNPDTVQNINPVPAQNDVLPGGNKAVLTLADGSKIILDSAANGILAQQGLATVVKSSNGEIIYKTGSSIFSQSLVYNNMSTPKGGQYKLTLPDGTNVWLNAASSITYPTAFTRNKREVSIIGEVYFEVTKNPKQPFTVKTFKEEITVLGTHFNVNAYQDEPLSKTSLLEGAIKIGDKILKPGEAYMNDKVSKTNLDQDLAWKHGVFDFNDQNLEQVMRQLSRWYDVEVIYPKNIPKMEFWGEMGRNLKLSQVLEILEKSEVKFKIVGRKRLVVLP